MKGSFSVVYEDLAHPDYYCAVDWDHWEIGLWIKSSKDKYGLEWYPEGRLDLLAYRAILEKFGLQDWTDELPLEEVQFTSPARLAGVRRAKEKENIFTFLEIISDTLGDYRSAEEYI